MAGFANAHPNFLIQVDYASLAGFDRKLFRWASMSSARLEDSDA